MNCEYLVIGQGLAGTLAAHALEDLGASFIIMDGLKPYSASAVAAGIIHPVSGRRFVKAWNYDVFVPEFKSVYGRIGDRLRFNPLKSLDMHISLGSTREENDFLSQAQRYGYSDQLHPLPATVENMQSSFCRYGMPAFKVDIQNLVLLSRERWLRQNRFFKDHLDYRELRQIKTKWQYRNILADQVIFCEGCFVRENPWFRHLPIVPNKGQIFLMDHNNENELDHIDRHTLLFTRMNDQLWMGATYEWEFDTPCPDSGGWEYLSRKLKSLMNKPPMIRVHASGLRPTVMDRKPIIASHPQFPNLWSINGFGTKGASIGPFVVNHFIQLVTGREKINLFAPDRNKESLP